MNYSWMVAPQGIEPRLPGLQPGALPSSARAIWWTHRESNPGPLGAGQECYRYHHEPTSLGVFARFRPEVSGATSRGPTIERRTPLVNLGGAKGKSRTYGGARPQRIYSPPPPSTGLPGHRSGAPPGTCTQIIRFLRPARLLGCGSGARHWRRAWDSNPENGLSTARPLSRRVPFTFGQLSMISGGERGNRTPAPVQGSPG